MLLLNDAVGWERIGAVDEQLVGTRKNPRCCNCHQRIKSEPRRGVWPAIKHNPRCPAVKVKQETGVAVAPAPDRRSQKRRAESDPGELSAHAIPPALTRRITPPRPVPASKEPRMTRQEERILRQLDETHARRMAAEAAAAGAAAGPGAATAAESAGERGTTHTGFAMVFVP